VTVLDDDEAARLILFATTPDEVVAGRFELFAPLGEGGMAVVWSAWDLENDCEVALKILRDTDEAARARFAREVAALLDLEGQPIPRAIAHGLTDAGAPFLAMERLSGRTLAKRLATGALGMREAITFGLAAARALAAVHAAGLVHRDIKPTNLFLIREDPADVRLLDFGLARGRDGLRVTRTRSLVGTPGYMAPEQARGDAEVSAAADVFALGATLFECLAGRPAFSAEHVEHVLTKILLEDPPGLRSLRPTAPRALEALVASMLDKRPEARPTAASVAAELTSIEAALGDQAEGSLPAVGSLVSGKYLVEGTIGEGGMGVILAATHVELGRKVALKLLRARQSAEDEARLYREARALSRLKSEHAARVLDVGRLDDGAPYVVIEHLEGKDLARVLRERGTLPIDEAVRHVIDASEAIAEAHDTGIVHRDLKPSNLFLTRRRDGSSCIKVLDFGISKVEGDAPSDRALTAPTAVLGSPWYMSPEQLTASKHVDARTDVWALGVVLHELCAGAPPFDAETAAGVGARIAAGDPVKLRAARPDAPEALERVVLRCLEKDPEARYPTVDDLARDLTALADKAPPPPDKAPRSRGLALPMLVAAGVIAVVTWALLARGRAPVAAPSRAPSSVTPSAMAPSPPAATSMEPVTTAPAPTVSASPPPGPSASATAAPPARPPHVSQPAVHPRSAGTAGPRAPSPPRTIDLRDPALDGR
jgi:eukaryotic-like serine/threonine-protein kinase